MPRKEFQSSFNGGEASPAALARIDIARYPSMCKTLENYIILAVGGATRRDGFVTSAETKISSKKTRMIPYSTGPGDTFMLEFGDLYFRIFQNGAPVLSGSGSELITNGNFPTDIASWTDKSTGGGVFLWSDIQKAELQAETTGDVAHMEQSITTVSGKIYRLKFDKTENPLGTFSLLIGTTSGGTEILSRNFGSGSHTVDFTATSTTTFIGFKQLFDSVPAPLNLVTNGAFAGNIFGWTDNSLGAGLIKHEPASPAGTINLQSKSGGPSPANATQEITGLTVGLDYIIFYDIVQHGNSLMHFMVGTTDRINDSGSDEIAKIIHNQVNVTAATVEFTATTTNIFITMNSNPTESGTFNSYWDNIIMNEKLLGIRVDNVSAKELTDREEITTLFTESDLDDLDYEQFDDSLIITSPDFKVRKITPGNPGGWAITLEDYVKSTKIDGATGANIGNMTTGGNLAAAFDGDVYKTGVQSAQSAAGVEVGFVGKDWGAGNERALKGVVIWSSTDDGFWGTEDPEILFQIQASNDNFAAETVILADIKQIDKVNTLTKIEIFNLIDTRTKYRYHRLRIEAKSDNATPSLAVAELEFFEAVASNPVGLNDGIDNFAPAVGSFQQRLITGGQINRSMTVYGSVVGDPLNLSLGDANDNDGFEYELVGQSAIQWFTEDSDLLVGTAHGIIRMTGGAAPLTPNNRQAALEISIGAAKTRPVQLGNATLYIQSDSKRIQEIVFDFNANKLAPSDMNALAEHIANATGEKFLGITPQSLPNRILWAWRADGRMVGLTYNRAEQVIGWHQHPMINGKVESMASIPRDDGAGIDVYAIINRTIEGSVKRTVEIMEEGICADGAVKYSGVPASTLTGYDHLEGETVVVQGDGANIGSFVVLNGQVNLPAGRTVTVAHGGKQNIPKMIPVPPIRGAGVKRRFATVNVKLENTSSLYVNGRRQTFRRGGDPLGEPVPLFTGNKKVVVLGWSEDPEITFEAREPLPSTILAYWGWMESAS